MGYKPNTKITLNGLSVVKYASMEGMENGDKDGDEILTGEYVIEEYFPYEPSNYVWSPYCLLISVDYKDGDPWYEVDADVLWRHLNPEAAKREDRMFIEMEIAELTRDLANATGEHKVDIQHQIEEAQKHLTQLGE